MNTHFLLKAAIILISVSGIFTSGYAQNQYISALLNKNLVFKTNDTARMKITVGGYVGIGTASPTEKLEINGNFKLSGIATLNRLFVTHSIIADSITATHGTFNYINVLHNTLVPAVTTDTLTVKRIVSDSAIYIQSSASADTVMNTIINANNGGRVGIGTSNPTEKLSVIGNIKASNMIKAGYTFQADSLAGEGYKFDINSSKSYKLAYIDELGNIVSQLPLPNIDPVLICGPKYTIPWSFGGNVITTGLYNFIGTCNEFPFSIHTNGIERMRITETGNVGIGTTNPLQKLHVVGTSYFDGKIGIGTAEVPNDYILGIVGKTITSDEVIIKLQVNGHWPDYVFGKDYKLPELTEVEKFAKANKHLPGIPSAADIKEKGLPLAEMNTLLLKKVEELTLYLISQDKKLSEQQQQITEQQQQINELVKKVSDPK
jgi:hypothetical protein